MAASPLDPMGRLRLIRRGGPGESRPTPTPGVYFSRLKKSLRTCYRGENFRRKTCENGTQAGPYSPGEFTPLPSEDKGAGQARGFTRSDPLRVIPAINPGA